MSRRPTVGAGRRTGVAVLGAGAAAVLWSGVVVPLVPPVSATDDRDAAPSSARSGDASDRDGDGLPDAVELGATAVRTPSLAPLTTALARRSVEPVRLLFLGSSTTFGVGATSIGARYVDRFVARTRAEFPVAGQRDAAVRDLQRSADHPAPAPGVQGINGAAGGSTAATYLSDAHAYGVGIVQPTCVVHMIGSNDSVAQVPVATYRAQVEAAIDRIDAVVDDPPCHVLLQPVRRYQVGVEAWNAYRDALREVASSRPRVTFVDVGGAFEARDALGADPEDLIGPDAVHPTDRGHALIAETLFVALGLTPQGLGTGTAPDRADTDRDGISDRRELRTYVVRADVRPCTGRAVRRLRTGSLPFVADTDGDGLSDGRELRGYRLDDGRVVRSDPADADTDGDRASDRRESVSRNGDPLTCARRRPTG
ncbi:lysophospholipase L1-like esterase [Nocardioides cavernae]|uniref:Lysophospholipase L1-like esterase n=1 Tax=Nocardioides cavernae TaxID=1921566 RepID=A0A7Y9H6C4_9ACTN|nr:SGNH/GDSL hydrolase family protein [Nocardioides cavernae]NYE38737.1 lysophospholipase L1-like esterase [Nocardioides cavernae]